jgi:cyclopropane-fatty-acyl-phospholipid synthase
VIFWQRRLDRFVEQMRGSGVPLRISLWDGAEAVLGDLPRVTFRVPAASSLRYLINPTLDSLGRAYVEGKLEMEGKLTDVIDVAAKLAAFGGVRARRPSRRYRHTRERDAVAVSHHYDVSNEFYARWLDSNMVYSCGYFRTPQDSLEDAQIQKIDHILTKLSLRPGDRLLDIGCGWGALIMRAASQFGASCVGITLSRNQYELARERIAAAGLSGRCEVRIEDYRDVAGRFDRITSVGMFEHVGRRNLRQYFAKVRDLLQDNGAVMNHGITSTDPDSADTPYGGGDFIERYVFPLGELPHIGLTLTEMSASGLEAVDVENLRRHYVLTLNHWAERFEAAGQPLRELAGEARWRIWRLYLAGCALGFARDWMSLHQILAVKAGGHNDVLPMTRDYMYAGSPPAMTR